MRGWRILTTVVVVLAAAAIVAIFFLRVRRTEAVGPALALCPGPDPYGYTCSSGAGYPYIDATVDTELYDDDATINIALPFPFVFYGATYESVYASTNGALSFTSEFVPFFNRCFSEGVVDEAGELIAPFWDDLDLRFAGALEHELVGEPPQRVFVLEWEAAPRFGAESEGDSVTFEVQLHEASHDIVFLYKDVLVAEGENGRSATIGLQSARLGQSLQFGCDQAVVTDGAALAFPFPDEPAVVPEDQNAAGPDRGPDPAPVAAKGDVAWLADRVARDGAAALPALRLEWLQGRPGREMSWDWANMTGDDRPELLVYWRGPRARPQKHQLAVLSPSASGRYEVLFDRVVWTRDEAYPALQLQVVQDVTGEGQSDALFYDEVTGRLLVLTAAGGDLKLWPLAGACHGRFAVKARDGAGQVAIIRDRCQGAGHLYDRWRFGRFVQQRH